jgi:hypothetical protein
MPGGSADEGIAADDLASTRWLCAGFQAGLKQQVCAAALVAF